MVNNEQLKEYQKYVEDVELENKQLKNENVQLSGAYGQSSLFSQASEDNLIRWQLDLKEDLDRIYHLLKGHQIKEDKEGNIFYAEPKDPNLIPFNESGVQSIMNIMSFYLNRNTILSNYDNETIQWKVYDFGNCIADFIFNRYESLFYVPSDKKVIEYILSEEEKKLNEEDLKKKIKEIQQDILMNKIKMYPVIIQELVDTVHSAYLRAFRGGERESLRTARTVTQSEPLAQSPINQPAPPRSKFSPFRPSTWRV